MMECSTCGKKEDKTDERKNKAGSSTKPNGSLGLKKSLSLQPSIVMECGSSESDMALSKRQNIVTISVDIDRGTVQFVK